MSYAGHLKDTNENLLITTNYLNVWHFLFHMVQGYQCGQNHILRLTSAEAMINI